MINIFLHGWNYTQLKMYCQMNKLNLRWKKELTARIQLLAGENEAAFIKKTGISDQAFRKYLKGTIPGGANILKIAEAANVSTDWLLTGKEPAGSPCSISCDERLKELCKKVKKVIESKTPYAAALEANILCFEDSINVKREMENLKAVTSGGPGGDMPGDPAEHTAKKQKAG